jgi:hypothetical protein
VAPPVHRQSITTTNVRLKYTTTVIPGFKEHVLFPEFKILRAINKIQHRDSFAIGHMFTRLHIFIVHNEPHKHIIPSTPY